MSGQQKSVQVGGTSIIMVFTLLFFAMFAALSLSSATVDLRHSQRARAHNMDYYAADTDAAIALAKLTAGDFGADGRHTFTVPLGQLPDGQTSRYRQELTVTAALRKGGLVIEEYRVQMMDSGSVIIDDGPGVLGEDDKMPWE